MFGTTFSHHQARSYGLEPLRALEDIIALGLSPIRLCCYWSEIQATPNHFDFTAITSLLEVCQRTNTPVVLCLGMKAPRWPEFYFPPWLEEPTIAAARAHLFIFLEKTVTALKHFSCITHYQVENEPLDPSGPQKLRIPFELLSEEVSLVRQIDPTRPIILTAWGNTLTQRGYVSKLSQIADIVGIDIYPKVPWSFLWGWLHGYTGPRDSRASIRQLIANNSKPVWIAELQSEPWELVPLAPEIADCQSMNPAQLDRNIRRAATLGAAQVLLWGSEYWLWRQSLHDKRYLDLISRHV